MIKVNKDNFRNIYIDFEKELNKCKYIAYDLEFSGLLLKKEHEANEFDDNQMRHLKLKMTAENFDIYQVGLTLIYENKETKTYEFSTFKDNYKSSCVNTVDNQCLKFLVAHGLDLNECIHKGISYMNKDKEAKLRDSFKMAKKNKIKNIKESRWLKKLKENIKGWIEDTVDPCYDVTTSNDYYAKIVFQVFGESEDYFLAREKNEFNRKIIRFFRVLETKDKTKENYIQKRTGFSRIISLISKSKKPIIGHNTLLDLYYIYSKFVDKIPEDFLDFRKNLMKVFPLIYDTKALITFDENLSGTFDRGTSLEKAFRITKENVKISTGRIHTSGFDSVMTGSVFLYLIDKKKEILNVDYPLRNKTFSIRPQRPTSLDIKEDYTYGEKFKKVFLVRIDTMKKTRDEIMFPFQIFAKRIKYIPINEQFCFVKLTELKDEYSLNQVKEKILKFVYVISWTFAKKFGRFDDLIKLGFCREFK